MERYQAQDKADVQACRLTQQVLYCSFSHLFSSNMWVKYTLRATARQYFCQYKIGLKTHTEPPFIDLVEIGHTHKETDKGNDRLYRHGAVNRKSHILYKPSALKCSLSSLASLEFS